MDTVSRLWEQALQRQDRPAVWLIVLTAALAVGLIAPRRVWPVTRNVVTIAHEGAHALVALCCGRRLSGISLHSDTSGVTVSAGKPTGLGMILTAAAGYIGPALIGLGAALLLSHDRATGMLVTTLALLTLMLVMIRNLYGAGIVLATGAATYAVLTYTPEVVQSAFAYLLVWFLVLAAPRPVWELQQHRRDGQTDTSDADQLAALTGIPGLAWVGLFALVTLAAPVLAVRWLLWPA